MNIKAAIFDLDGTLVDSLMLWDIFWSALGEKYLGDKRFKPTKEDDHKVRTLTLKDAMDLIHTNYNFGNSGEELLEFSNKTIFEFYSKDVLLKSGVREFLDYLKTKGVKMCIASATSSDLLEIALTHCDIKKYFSKVFSCVDIGKGKEEPDIFLKAYEFLGEPKEETYVFEDSITAIETAVKIGIPTVGIYDKYNNGQEKIKKIANEYIAKGETLLKLI